MRIPTIALSGLLALSAIGAAQAAPMPAYNWSGFYAGVAGSYTWSHSQSTYDYAPLQTGYPQAAMDASAAGLGVLLGVNHQTASGLVFGIEGGVTYVNLNATIPDDYGNDVHSGTGPHTISSNTDWVADIRGRLGFASGNMLLYATAGISGSHTTASATDGPLSETATLSSVLIGGGVEKALSQKVSVKVEYIHSILREYTWYAGQLYSATSTGTADSVRAGINLHF
jgi:opacity protein-like surface antigen